MRKLLISHIDLDGTGAPVIVSLYFREYFDKILLLDYGFEEDDDTRIEIESYDEIVIADLSAPEEYIESLIRKGKDVKIYDHHIHASWLADKPYGVYDETRSGSKIFWEEWAKPKLGRYYPITDHFIDLIDTYDRWQQTNPLWEDAKALNSVLYNKTMDWNETNALVKYTPFIERMSNKIRKSSDSWSWTMIEEGWIQDSLKKEKDALDKALSTMKIRKDYKGKKFAIIAIGSKISLICSKILDMRDDLDYIVCLNLYRGLNGKLSFRSKRDDLDLNDIVCCAGHAQATGGQVMPELAEKFWNNDNLCWAYRDMNGLDMDRPSSWLIDVRRFEDLGTGVEV